MSESMFWMLVWSVPVGSGLAWAYYTGKGVGMREMKFAMEEKP